MNNESARNFDIILVTPERAIPPHTQPIEPQAYRNLPSSGLSPHSLHPSQLWCRKWHRTCIWRYPYRRGNKHRRSIPPLAHYWRLISATIALLNTCKLWKLSEHGIFYDCVWSFYNGRRWYFFNSKNRAEISVPVQAHIPIRGIKSGTGVLLTVLF